MPERFPIILQDTIVIALILLASTFLSSQLVTTSAVSAVVIGFALQDTLGNAFAGLAIQSERPFHVGQWVKVGDHEGRVAEVTWRATKLRTKAGNFVDPAEQRRREGSRSSTTPSRRRRCGSRSRWARRTWCRPTRSRPR